MELVKERERRIKWFSEARLGMFIHWGLYAIPARGEWVRSVERISNAEYQKYFEQFNPTDYDPRQWAKTARAAGMKYAVLTAKHHDGFCLFDSALTDYKSTNTPAKRDLVKEYLDAFRAEGLKVGLYYSLLDWYHKDFPAYGDRQHPMRDNEEYKGKKQDFSKYIEYFHGQVKELLTGYGKIDIMWFDFSYNDMKGEKWEATKLVTMMRSFQPDIIIDNRLGGNIKSSEPEIYAGDFASPEQIIPPGEITDEKGGPVPWEACVTLNDHWGYAFDDDNYKSARQVIRALVECVSKGGNLLVNVGPDARGLFPQKSVELLEQIGEWMARNGESVYGCGLSQLPKPEWGRYTQKGNNLYAHIYERGIGPINFNGLNGKIAAASLLADDAELIIETPWNAEEFSEDAFLSFKSSALPDEKDTVVKLVLK